MPKVKGITVYDSLSYRKYTSKSEADKAIQTLKGILLAIGFDSIISTGEINELKKWCEQHRDYIDRNPFREFMQLILSLPDDNLMRLDAIDDLYWLCQKYESDSVYYKSITPDIQILHGICHGILSDGVIRDSEIHKLDSWLETSQHLATYYPFDELRSLVINILSDGIIDDDERKLLAAYLNEFCLLTDSETRNDVSQLTSGIKTTALCSIDPNVVFKDKLFCFTGIFKNAMRSDLIKIINKLEGKFHNTIVAETDYLIVGDNGNPCFAYACYGRKVEKAMQLRKSGARISIIHEFDFWDFVEDARN